MLVIGQKIISENECLNIRDNNAMCKIKCKDKMKLLTRLIWLNLDIDCIERRYI